MVDFGPKSSVSSFQEHFRKDFIRITPQDFFSNGGKGGVGVHNPLRFKETVHVDKYKKS